jgi:uncharacterized protein YjiS (DUF1127 family)
MEVTMNYFARLLQSAHRRRVLSDLLQYDDRLLRDMGLSRADLNAMRYRRAPSPGRGDE